MILRILTSLVLIPLVLAAIFFLPPYLFILLVNLIFRTRRARILQNHRRAGE